MNATCPLQAEATVHRCAPRDLPKLEWLGRFTPHREILHEAFERQRRDGNTARVADLRGFSVAQVWLDRMRPKPPQIGLLWAPRVISWLQRPGIGTRMLAAAEQTPGRRGSREAELGVEKASPAAALYRRAGYRDVGDRHEQYRYTRPAGERGKVPVDQGMLRKRVAVAASQEI